MATVMKKSGTLFSYFKKVSSNEKDKNESPTPKPKKSSSPPSKKSAANNNKSDEEGKTSRGHYKSHHLLYLNI